MAFRRIEDKYVQQIWVSDANNSTDEVAYVHPNHPVPPLSVDGSEMKYSHTEISDKFLMNVYDAWRLAVMDGETFDSYEEFAKEWGK